MPSSMGAEGGPVVWSDTKERSILRMSIGSRARVVREVYPDPKLSMAMRTPQRFKVLMVAMAAATSAVRAVSVISSMTWSACRAGSARICLDGGEAVRVAELEGGEVDRDPQVGAVGHGLAPGGGLAGGGFEDPGGHGVDVAGFFGHGDELGGGEQAEGGVLPADEGFDAENLAGAQIGDGLVVEAELA